MFTGERTRYLNLKVGRVAPITHLALWLAFVPDSWEVSTPSRPAAGLRVGLIDTKEHDVLTAFGTVQELRLRH